MPSLIPARESSSRAVPRVFASWRLTSCVLALVAIACADVVEPTSPRSDMSAFDVDGSRMERTGGVESLERVAAILAAAMGDEGARSSVLSAMQRSTVHEHKLSLRGFLRRSDGRTLRRIARQIGRDRGLEFGQLLESLPGEMDFYMPSAGDRRSWTGGSEVSVAAIVDVDETERATAFLPTGESVGIGSPSDAPGAFFLLHPSEVHVPGGPPAGAATVETPAPGTTSRLSITSVNDCILECGDLGGGGGGTAGGTYASAVSANFGDGGWGNVEVYFRTCETDGQNRNQSVEISFPGGGQWFGDLHLHDFRADLIRLVAGMWEADSGLNGSDDFKGFTCLALAADGECVQEFIGGAASYLSIEGVSQIWGEYVITLG